MLLILSYRYDYIGIKRQKWAWYYFIMFILICVAGFRYHLGVDTWRYQTYFETEQPDLSQLDFSELGNYKYDPLYNILVATCKTIIPEFWFVQLVQAIIVNVAVFHFFRKYSKNVFIAITFYYIYLYIGYHFETMRESCAIAMMLFGYEQFKNGRKLISLIFFVVSFFFHSSALILLPVWIYLLFADNKVRIGYWVWIIAIVAMILSPIIVNQFQDYLLLITLNDRIEGKIDTYQDSIFFDQHLNWKGMISFLFTNVLYPLVLIMSLKHYYKDNRYPHESMVLWALYMIVLSAPITIFYRYVNYFMPFIILVLADTFSTRYIYLTSKIKIIVPSYQSKFLIIFLPIFLLTISTWLDPIKPNSNLKNYMKVYPYSSIFNPEDNPQRDAVMRYIIE